MIVEKDWYFKLICKKTKKITCKVFFRIVDTKRKVNINTTGLLLCEIKRWVSIYEEKIVPNLEKDSEEYKDAKNKYLFWKIYKDYLIPENRSLNNHDFSEQYFVKLNNKLLRSNKLLSYNQALFLLLGLDATELDRNFKNFPTLIGTEPNNPFYRIFWNTEQNQELKTSVYIKNGKITSEDLTKLAEEHSFFIQKDSRIAKRHLDKNISRKIYNILISHKYITGDYDDMWIWNKGVERNKLAYFAKRLKQKHILGNNCHKELSNYIPDPKPNTKQPLKNRSNISHKAMKIIDSIVDEIVK